LMRAPALEPGRSNDPGDWPSADLLDEVASGHDPPRRLGAAQAEEFALAGGRVARLEAIGLPGMAGFVPMIITMEEQLDASVRPASQPRRKSRAGHDWRFAPMIGD